MKIKLKSYLGIVGFYLRKIMPNICSNMYLFLQRNLSNYPNKKYMKFPTKELVPLFVNIETISKCNGLCSFCCCNVKEDVRPKKIMMDELFEKVICDLEKINYDGVITLNINNEPFLDTKILEKLLFIRKKIPNAYSYLYTNGSLLTIEKMQKIIDENLLDELVINNYSTKYKLNKNIEKLYEKFKKCKLNFKVTINLRYSNEVLSNRANTAPNKKGSRSIKAYCSIPYTDLNVFPDGVIGLCCCDTKELTNFGNAKDDNIISIFNNEKFKIIRKKMLGGRAEVNFCKFCDFNDIGTRRKKIKYMLSNNRMR